MTCAYDEPLRAVQAQGVPGSAEEWRGPKGYTLLSWEVDFRRGGAARLRVRQPAGRDQLLEDVQLEIMEPERVVFRCDPGCKHLPEPGTFTFRRA